jgi:mannose-1-phosphate guanylyltransferase/mannose-6-phosphate isomerase
LDETPPQTLAALATVQNGKKPVLVVTPAEQTIAKPSALTAALQQAIAQAEQGSIVILGVTPDKPETSYGYILTDQRTVHPRAR